MNNQDDGLLTKATLAEFLAMSPRWINSKIAAIPHFRIGREYRFRKCEVLEWLEQYREIGTTVDLNAIGESAASRIAWNPKRKAL